MMKVLIDSFDAHDKRINFFTIQKNNKNTIYLNETKVYL